MSAVAATGPIALIPGRRLLAAVVPRATANASGGWWRWPNGVKPMTSTDSDAVVISAGHNGLLAAADLSSRRMGVTSSSPTSKRNRIAVADASTPWDVLRVSASSGVRARFALRRHCRGRALTLTVCRRFGMLQQEKS